MHFKWKKHVLFPIILCVFSMLVFNLFLNKQFFKFHLYFWFGPISESHSLSYSSVSCRGNNHTDRQCMFKNLCYDSLSKNFLFFYGSESVVKGIPEDRFSPALTDFSSVYDHNTQYFNFIDLPYSAIVNFNISFLSGISLIFKRFNPENLMHVFHDDLIPAFVTLDEIFFVKKKDVQFVFADGRNPGIYSYLYENFLISKPVYLESSKSQTVCFENAIVGLSKSSLWYQYGFKQPQGPQNKDMSNVFPLITSFRKYFYKQFSLQDVSGERNTAVLLTRKHNRKILNAEEVAKLIYQKTHLKTSIFNLENNSVMDVIKEIMTSKLVVGIHGSLLILSIFLSPNSNIIELFPYAINPDICTPYRTITKIPGLYINYYSWENKIEKNSFPHPEYPAELGGIYHLPKEKQESIKRSIVKPFLCCYNPDWLYRIYQDTIVDINSFSNVIDNMLKYTQAYKAKMTDLKKFYPSDVQNISCNLSTLNTFNISWEDPWNVHFINISTIEYELWYQDNENDDVKAFIMKKNYFVFKEIVSPSVYIWIRCHLDNRIGPFNTDPFICLRAI